MPLFYLCSRPGTEPAAGILAHLYNAKWPRFLARVEKLGEAGPVAEIGYRGANVVFSMGLDGGQPSEYLLIVEDNIDKADYPRLIKPLQKAVEWYMQIAAGKEGASRFEYSLLEDYSPETPALQVIYFEKTEEFLLSHEKGIAGFNTVDDVDDYMRVILKVPETVIGSGNINTEGF